MSHFVASLPLGLFIDTSQPATPQARKSVVGYRTNGGRPKPLSQLTIKGRWLEPLGFTTGQRIEVITEPTVDHPTGSRSITGWSIKQNPVTDGGIYSRLSPMSKKHTEVSKFLSYVLRHQPEAIGLSLDKDGWAVIDELIICADKEGYELDHKLLHSIVADSNKKRFTISDDKLYIRAAQGHSTQQVDIKYQEKTPPEILFHGTATRFLVSIREQGLVSKTRQYVHLSSDEATAMQVGQRHGKPIVLKIKALHMFEQGFKFYQADNGVWLSNTIPYQFIQE